MAQHIDIRYIEHKRFEEIGVNILKHFRKGLTHIRGSLRFEALPKEYKEHESDLVFGTTYKIPYDEFVHKSDEGYFEIHFDQKIGRIDKIYLVA